MAHSCTHLHWRTEQEKKSAKHVQIYVYSFTRTYDTLWHWITLCEEGIYTVQTLDLILLCTRCIPQMHFWIASKIHPQLIPCLEGNFTQAMWSCPKSKISLHSLSWSMAGPGANFLPVWDNVCRVALLHPLLENFLPCYRTMSPHRVILRQV